MITVEMHKPDISPKKKNKYRNNYLQADYFPN